MLGELSIGYWLTAWSLMTVTVIVIWIAIVIGASKLDGQIDT